MGSRELANCRRINLIESEVRYPFPPRRSSTIFFIRSALLLSGFNRLCKASISISSSLMRCRKGRSNSVLRLKRSITKATARYCNKLQ